MKGMLGAETTFDTGRPSNPTLHRIQTPGWLSSIAAVELSAPDAFAIRGRPLWSRRIGPQESDCGSRVTGIRCRSA